MKILSRYQATSNKLQMVRWHRSFWPHVLPKMIRMATQNGCDASITSVVAEVLALFAAKADGGKELSWTSSLDLDAANLFGDSLRLSDIQPGELSSWFSASSFNRGEAWLTQECFCYLFPIALLGEHDGARECYTRLRGKDFEPDKVKRLLKHFFAEGVRRPALAKKAIILANDLGDITAVKTITTEILRADEQAFDKGILSKLTCTSAIQTGLTHSSPQQRYAAVYLYNLLTGHGQVDPPSLEQWQRMLEWKESSTLATVIEMAPYLYTEEHYPNLQNTLNAYLQEENLVSEAALLSRLQLLHRFSSTHLDRDLILDTFQRATEREQLDVHFVGALGFLIEEAVNLSDISFALELVERLYRDASLHRMPKKRKKKVGHRFAKPISRLVSKLDHSGQIRLLDLLTYSPHDDVEGIEENLARPIIKSLIYLQDSVINQQFRELQKNERLNPEVRAMLGTYQFYHERPGGTRTWVELYKLTRYQSSLNQ